MPELEELITRLSERMATKIDAVKVDTVAEVKSNLRAMIAEELGTGGNTFKGLASTIETAVLQRVPQQSVFQTSRASGYNPEGGLRSLSPERQKELAKQLLWMIIPASVKSERGMLREGGLFGGQGERALGITVGAAGGFTLPEEFIAEVQRKLVHTSVFASRCRMWPNVGETGKMPRETGTVSVYIADQLVTPTQSQFALGALTWGLQKRMMLTNLPQELWKFSGIDVLELLATMFGEQAQKTLDYFFLLGTGKLQPMGLLTQTTGMTSLTMEGAKLQWQDTIDLRDSVRSQYRLERESCAYMTNNATISKISKLTDDQNRPVFIDRGSMGMGGENIPPQSLGAINGFAVVENPYTPGPVAETLNNSALTSVAPTATVVFANFKRGYAGFTGPAAEIKTSDQAYDAFLNDGLYTRYIDWFDGKPAIPEAVSILTGVQ